MASVHSSSDSELMSSGMKPLRDLQAFHDLTISMSDNPFLGAVIGTVFTLIVQSSSATAWYTSRVIRRWFNFIRCSFTSFVW